MRVKDAVGRYGEQVATDHLRAAGMQVLARNWRCRDGEIDVVALDGTTLVVVEVKTRSSDRFGSPLEAVGRAKMTRLRRLAVLWIAQAPEPRPRWESVRFDVIAVVRDPNASASASCRVDHVRGAF